MTKSKPRRSRSTNLLIGAAVTWGVLCAAAMLVGGALMIFTDPPGTDPAGYQRVSLRQKTVTVHFADSGRYTVYYEQRQFGKFIVNPDLQLRLTGRPAGGGDPLQVRPVGTHITSYYGFSNGAYTTRGDGILFLTVPRAGNYRVHIVDADSDDSPDDKLAFGVGSGTNPGVLWLAFGGAGLGLGAMVATATVQIRLSRRDREREGSTA